MDDNIRKTKQELSIQKWKQLIEDFNFSSNLRSGIVSAVAYCARYITPLVGPFIRKLSFLFLRRLAKKQGGGNDI